MIKKDPKAIIILDDPRDFKEVLSIKDIERIKLWFNGWSGRIDDYFINGSSIRNPKGLLNNLPPWKLPTPLLGVFKIQYKNVDGGFGGSSDIPRQKLEHRLGEGVAEQLKNGELKHKDTVNARYTWVKDKKPTVIISNS